MTPQDLIETSRKLAEGKSGKPSQSDLRRSLSTAYYALFHCLAKTCADTLIGKYSDTTNSEAWKQTYRSLEHAKTKNCCKNGKIMNTFPQEIQDFASVFIDLQEKRHRADYHMPTKFFWPSEVLSDIAKVERAIKYFSKAKINDRRSFASFVIMKNR